MTTTQDPCQMDQPLSCRFVRSLLAGRKKRAIYPHPDPDQADSPEIRCQLSRTTALPAPRSHTPRSHPDASRPADLNCPRNINLILDIVLNQTPAPRSPIAVGVTHKLSHGSPLLHVRQADLDSLAKYLDEAGTATEKLPIRKLVRIGHPLALLARPVPSGPSRALYGT